MGWNADMPLEFLVSGLALASAANVTTLTGIRRPGSAYRHSPPPLSSMKFVSWNVNGVRAAHKKGLLDFMEKAQADVICLQEAKAHPGDVQHIAWPRGYQVFWNPAVKKGYSGTIV